ncbi:hypothetical protein, partial [Acinetobacter baumannii]
MRNLTASIILAIGLTGSAFADTTPAKQTEQPATTVTSSTVSTQGTATTTIAPTAENTAAPTGEEAKTATSETPVTEENTSASTGDAAQTAQMPENATQGTAPELVTGGGFAEDLSVMGMYRNADLVVKS